MNQNPTIPPVPKRPPAKPVKIPPVVETRAYHIDPYQGINQIHPAKPVKRHHTPSEVDLEVVRHDEQLKALERRVDGLEEVTGSIDTKLDKITESLTQEISERKLEKAAKEEIKVKEDQKSKRLQAILIAIPLILSPILGFASSYLSKPTPSYQSSTVVVSEYTQEVAKCKEISQSQQQFTECVRDKQLKNTPIFEK